MNSWDILGLAPTKGLGAIRRAYAATAAQYNPEDHPEEFLAVRQAYEQAAAYARGQEPSLPPRNGSTTAAMFGEGRPAGTQLGSRSFTLRDECQTEG